MAGGERKRPPASIEFGTEEWAEEVERLDERSSARVQAERARREIEKGGVDPDWKRCRPEDARDGTSLPGCLKLYVPLGGEGASDAPFGFVFQLDQKPDKTLELSLLAFGERHPTNPSTRTVYERAHRRLHGRYP